jgi:Kef-type K+ transport system membrane component KefB
MCALNKGEDRVSIKEQLFLVLIAAFLGLCVLMLGVADKWFAAIFWTVSTFAGVLALYRKKKLNRRSLGLAIMAVFVGHLMLMWVIFAIVLRKREDVGLLVCIPFIFVESFFVYHAINFLYRRFLPR